LHHLRHLLVIVQAQVYSRRVSPVLVRFEGEVMKFKSVIAAIFSVLFLASIAYSQGKGVDTQSSTVRDSGNSRTPGINGAKQDTGTNGSGITFGKEKGRATASISNPYRLTARRDAILKAVAEVMRDRKLILDDAASRSIDGIIVSQPYTFIKGAVVTQSELSQFANIENADARGWTRARYTIIVDVQPIDGVSSNVSVNAKIEGRTDGATGAEWITLQSTGMAEQEFLSALIEHITGTNPAERPQP
jgi:hypothetical protein